MPTNKNKATTALAVADDFQIVQRFAGLDPELLEELQDQMEDLDPEDGIACRQIKIPSGGGLAYEVQGEEDTDTEYMKQIDAVVVFTHRANGFWSGAYGSGDDQNKVPACSSMDGKTAIWTDTGEMRSCENCPMNQYGSGTDQKGNQSRGKACKNMRRLYLLMSGDPNLYLLTVPPTSIKDVNKQLAKIIAGGTPYTGLTVRLTLEKAQNASGVAYSKVAIKKSGTLPPAAAKIIAGMRQQIKAQYKSVALTMDDYAPAPAQGDQGQGRPAPAGAPVDVGMSDEEWQALTGEPTQTGPADFQEAPPASAGSKDPDLPFG